MKTAPCVIEPLVLPSAVDAPDAGDFLEYGALSDALVLETWRNPDRTSPPAARLQFWRDSPYTRMSLFFVRQDGRMVAKSWIRFALQDNVRTALLRVDVLNEFTGLGIGRALLRHAEELAASQGRTTLQTFTEHPAGFDAADPGLLKPGTGTGGLPRDDRAVRFAGQAGYRLEQVSRFSALELPPDPATLDELERKALDKAAEQYELLHWTDRCPEEYAEQLALLMSRMSTDAPTGGLSYDEETWDAARVRHVEQTWKQSGQESLVAAARHRASGELAAYSVLQVSAGKPWLANQDDTLVARHHRGHRLGMLVKILNLRRMAAGHPAVERVTTFNAAENDHMLAINVALGFRPAGYDGEWQKMVPAATAPAAAGPPPGTQPGPGAHAAGPGSPV